jgi:hypothetical protein
MHSHHTSFSLSRWVRLVALSLLLGFGLLTGTILASRTAHAQTTLTVSNCSNDSQLQADVTQANSDNAGDTINFSCSGDIIVSQTLNITGSMTLDGSGQSVTLDGNYSLQVLIVQSGASVTLKALTVAHGFITNNFGGGLSNSGTLSISNSTFASNSAVSGGGLSNSGTLSISNSTFANNSAVSGGGSGGGLSNNGGTVSISNSTFANNSATHQAAGGGLSNGNGTVSISNSTVANNSADYGGGLYNAGQASSINIINSTFANNSGTYFGGGLYNGNGTLSISNSTIASNSALSGNGGGLYNNGTASIGGSIVANNSGGDCSLSVALHDQGYNLESGSSCGFTSTGSLQNSNPQLSLLANNGGPTQTMALQQGSPAIDTIPVSTTLCPATDQRGTTRPDNGETSCDMGAYEFTDPVDNDLGLSNMPSNITTNATSPQGAVVTYTLPTVVDEDNPLPPVNCSPASGSTFAIGTTTVTCTATDSDDTPSSVSQSFSVTVNGAATQLNALISLVNSFHLAPGGIQTSFDSQLQAVQTDLTNNNTAQACSDLTSFMNHAQAQSGKYLTGSQADQMIAAAQQIQAVLGC